MAGIGVASTFTTSQVTVSATAVLLLQANTARIGASFANTIATSGTLYIGSSAVTTATGYAVPIGSAFNIDAPNCIAAVYGVIASGNNLIAVEEMI